VLAISYYRKIRDVYCEIVRFWNLDKRLIEGLERMDREGLK
jgi:hypothetical protein